MPANNRINVTEAQQFTAPPTPIAETPIDATPDMDAHYRVLHDGVDWHLAGAELTGAALGDTATLTRLLSLGAIVPVAK